VQFVRKLCAHSELQGVNQVILSGGFANSGYLKQRLLTEFPRLHFYVPKHPHLAVVKGALYWVNQAGTRDDIVLPTDFKHKKRAENEFMTMKKTRARYSYGIAIDRKFNAATDDPARRKYDKSLGHDIVANAFGSLVARNEEYEDGYTEQFDYWIPANTNNLIISLYASEDPYCRYVFDVDGKLEQKEEGKRCFVMKEFHIQINEVSAVRQEFKIDLEYRQDGINLFYQDPNDPQQRRKVEVTHKKPDA